MSAGLARLREAVAPVLGVALGATLLLVSAGPSAAQAPPGGGTAPPAPKNYVAALAGTTLAYRPNGGEFDGWQHDFSPSVGYGRWLSSKVAVEVDLGPTFVSGDYASFSIMPAVVWAFHPKVYGAARFMVPVDPEWNFILFPGIGVTHTFRNNVSPFLELNVSSAVGRGKPDLGVALTLGVLYSF
jgi:hypothetical protein